MRLQKKETERKLYQCSKQCTMIKDKRKKGKARIDRNLKSNLQMRSNKLKNVRIEKRMIEKRKKIYFS